MLSNCVPIRVTRIKNFVYIVVPTHVETVCLLSKLNVEHHIEVELNLDEMDLTAAESKATYEEVKEYDIMVHEVKIRHYQKE